jgi:hypothetical protein
MHSFARLHHDSNNAGIDFLFTELDAASTFLDVAGTTGLAETRERNEGHASAAYDTILRMQNKVVMPPDQQETFQERLASLKSRLEDLGYSRSPVMDTSPHVFVIG